MRRCPLRKTWVVLFVSGGDSAASLVRLMGQVHRILFANKFGDEASSDFFA